MRADNLWAIGRIPTTVVDVLQSVERRNQGSCERSLWCYLRRMVLIGVVEVTTHEIVWALEVVPTPTSARSDEDPRHRQTYCAGSESSLILSWMIGGGSTGFRSTRIRRRNVTMGSMRCRNSHEHTFLLDTSHPGPHRTLADAQLVVFASSQHDQSVEALERTVRDGHSANAFVAHLLNFTREEATSTKVCAFIKPNDF